MTDRMQTQRAEFDAMANLAEQYSRVTRTMIVDDDYPEVRHAYEGALATMLDAMKDNGRFVRGNRYGLAPHQVTLTDDFCETFPTKESCVGAMARFIPFHLPFGVNPNDSRVQQIIRWCGENYPPPPVGDTP